MIRRTRCPMPGQLDLFAAAAQATAGRAGRRFTYYLGGRPNWLGDHAFRDTPLMIAAPTLDRYRCSGWDAPDGAEVPDTSRRWGGWFGDSGAYMALTGSGTNRGESHPWHRDPDLYGGMWVRIIDDFGWPDFVAPQDMPCEEPCTKATGLTVRDHVELTVENYVYLRREFDMVPWVPVIQGRSPADYLYCAELYKHAGVDLAACRLVGIGSICRRAHVPEIVEVIRLFADRGYRMHAFGVKINALPIIGHLLASADSYAWSDTARKDRILLDGCSHRTRACAKHCPPGCREHLTDCRNCGVWAREWRRRALATVPSDGHPTAAAYPAMMATAAA